MTIMHIKEPNAETEAFMDSRFLRVPGELRWVRKPNAADKLASLARAFLGSATGSSEATGRLQICKGCACLQVEEAKMYCGCCGCGKNRVSELQSKVEMKKASCPLKKWGDA